MSLCEECARDEERPFLPLLGLTLTPTASMLRSDQTVWQHSWCGTVVVAPASFNRKPGLCPVCDRADEPWWRERLPLAGLSAPATGPSLDGAR